MRHLCSLLLAGLAACQSPPPASDAGGSLTGQPPDSAVARGAAAAGAAACPRLRYVPPPPLPPDTARQDYPDGRYDWILPVRLARPVARQRVREVFYQKWREGLYFTQVYGRSARTGRWLYLESKSADSVFFTALAFDWQLYNSDNPTDLAPLTAGRLRSLTRAVGEQAAGVSGCVGPPNYSISAALARSRQLQHFAERNNLVLELTLQADSSFAGPAAERALRALGLRPGISHSSFDWLRPVPGEGEGDDALFSVYTSVSPEDYTRMPDNRNFPRRLTDLIFSFSVPRSPDAEQVLAAMHQAAGCCQRQLGGRLLDEDGRPFSLPVARRQCRAVADSLRAHHLLPGVGPTLCFF